MKKESFEQQIKSKLDNWEVEPSPDMWNRIRKDLPQTPVVPSRPVLYRPWVWTAVAAMLTGIIFWLSLSPDNSALNQHLPQVAQNQPSPQPVVSSDAKKDTIHAQEPQLVAAVSAQQQPQQPVAARTLAVVRHVENGIKQQVDTPSQIQIKESRGEEQPETAVSHPVVSTNKERAQVNNNTRRLYDHTADNYYASIPQPSHHNTDSYSIGVMAVNPVSKNNTTTDRHSALTKSMPLASSFLSANNPDKEDLNWTHNVPLTFGLTVEKHFSRFIGLETGITYSYLKSEYKNERGSRYGNQELHYIGIPVTGIYRFARWNNFSFYTALGGKVDFNVAGRRTDRVNADYDGFRFQGDIEANTTRSIRDKRAQFSLMCKVGAAYSFVDNFEMYAEPGIAYYFNNNSSEIQNMWNDKPLNFALQIGVRTNF